MPLRIVEILCCGRPARQHREIPDRRDGRLFWSLKLIRDLLQAAIRLEEVLAEVAPSTGQEVLRLIGGELGGFGGRDMVQDPRTMIGVLQQRGDPLPPGSLNDTEDGEILAQVAGSTPILGVVFDVEAE